MRSVQDRAAAASREAADAEEIVTDDGQVLTPFDNGDGTYSYPLAKGFDPEARVVQRAVTWAYDHQQTIAYDPQPWGEQRYVYEGEDTSTRVERLSRRVRVDDEGRVWRVDSVDEELWDQLIAEADAESPDVWRDGDDLPPTSSDHEPEIGEEVAWRPMSWSSPCSGVDNFVWDAESRVEVTGNLNTRQLASVYIVVNDVVGCSGVLLKPDEVLTAAHCVTTPVTNGQDIQAADANIDVCLWGNRFSGTCQRGVKDLVISEDFDLPNAASVDEDDDWAVILLNADLSGASDMDMTTLNSLGTRGISSIGYPATTPGAPVSSCSSVPPAGSTSGFPARFMYRQGGIDITDYNGGDARWKGDHTEGESGSPVYYCAGTDDDCDPGEKGMVVSVIAGYLNTAFDDRWAGPRIPEVRDDILAVFPD